VRYALGLHGHERGDSGVETDLHYGAWKLRRGPARVVAVAAGPDSSAEAVRWLGQAAGAGADVSLIASDAPEAPGIRVRRLDRMGPLALIRALDAEEQLRTLDAVLAFGPSARLLLRAVPGGLRGALRGVSSELDPAAVRWEQRESLEAVLG
jgi:hypothetical protein